MAGTGTLPRRRERQPAPPLEPGALRARAWGRLVGTSGCGHRGGCGRRRDPVRESGSAPLFDDARRGLAIRDGRHRGHGAVHHRVGATQVDADIFAPRPPAMNTVRPPLRHQRDEAILSRSQNRRGTGERPVTARRHAPNGTRAAHRDRHIVASSERVTNTWTTTRPLTVVPVVPTACACTGCDATAADSERTAESAQRRIIVGSITSPCRQSCTPRVAASSPLDLSAMYHNWLISSRCPSPQIPRLPRNRCSCRWTTDVGRFAVSPSPREQRGGGLRDVERF